MINEDSVDIFRLISSGKLNQTKIFLDTYDNIARLFTIRDVQGRSILHLCCLSKSVKLLQLLQNYLLLSFQRKLCSRLDTLHEEENKSIDHIRSLGTSNGIKSSTNLFQRLEIVRDWYSAEHQRLRIQNELNLEDYWMSLLNMVDEDGRTPIHYAVVNRVSVSFLHNLLHFRSCHLNNRALYDLQTGSILVSIESDEAIHESNFSLSASFEGLSNESTALPDRVDYDVIIPWLIKNILKRCHDKVSIRNLHADFKDERKGHGYNDRRSSKDDDRRSRTHPSNELKRTEETSLEAIRTLEYYITLIDNEDTGILLYQEVKALLKALEIVVTKSVIFELCKLYPADIENTSRKFKFVTKLSYDQSERASRQSDKNDDNSREEKRNSSLKTISLKKEKIRFDDEKGKIRNSYDFKEYPIESSKDEKGFSTEMNDLGKMISIGDPDTMKEQILNHLTFHQSEPSEEFIGLDIKSFLNDVKTGRAVISSKKSKSYSKPSTKDYNQETRDAEKTFDVRTDFNRQRSIKSSDTSSMHRLNPSCLPRIVSTKVIQEYRHHLINLRDSYGRTALSLAIELNEESLVRELLQHGAQLIVSNDDIENNAISYATKQSIQRIIESHLVRLLSSRETILSPAVQDFTTSNIQNASNDFNTSLSTVKSSVTEMGMSAVLFNSLLPNISNLQKRHWSYSRSPLSWAVTNGLVDSVKYLLSRGMDPNSRDISGRSPLHDCSAVCRLTKNIETVRAAILMSEELFNKGIQPNVVSVSGRNALHEMFCMNQDESITVADATDFSESILNTMNNSNVSNVETSNSMKIDSSSDSIVAWKALYVRNLLHWGVDPRIYDRHGLTPLHYCARENMADCLVELLTTPLPSSWSSSSNDEQISLLIENLEENTLVTGNDMVRQEYMNAFQPTKTGGNTAMHIACASSSFECIQILSRWDADSFVDSIKYLINRPNHAGKSPRQLLLPNNSGKDYLDNIWMASREGDLNRVRCIVYGHTKEKQLKARNENRIIKNETLKSNQKIKFATTEKSSVEMSTQKDVEESQKLDNDDDNIELSDIFYKSPLISSKQGIHWLIENPLEAKSRRLKWTAIHACIIGWAEFSVKHMNNKCAQTALPELTFPPRSINKGLRTIKYANTLSLRSHSLDDENIKRTANEISKRKIRTQSTRTEQDYISILNFLIQGHAMVDGYDVNGRTPIMLASACNLALACKILLESGASVECMDNEGNSLRDLIIKFGCVSASLTIDEYVNKGAIDESE